MRLYFINGLKKDECLELSGDKLRIGRETDNTVVIETEGVSRYHAEFINRSGKWYIKDLGSTNGSKVNGKLVDGEQLLNDGDVVVLGDQELRLKMGNDEPEKDEVSPVIPVVNAEEKTEEKHVQKVVFQPMPKGTEEPDKKKDTPKPLETVKIKPEKAEPESAKSPLMTAKELSESAADIFDTKTKSGGDKSKGSEPVVKKHFFNILFYLILLLVVVIFVAWFLSYNEKNRMPVSTSTVKVNKIPLLLYYAKTKVSKDNIFRFSLLIENDNAVFTIDDLKSGRHHIENIKEIKPEFMKTLKSSIEDTGFMELKPVSSGTVVNNLDETRTMTIALDNKMNTFTIRNNSAPTSFEDIENAIMEFADGYDLLTLAMSPKELQKRAEESFAKAEEYYANRNARAANLLAAQIRYKVTIDYLQQFSPKPEIWEIAKKRHEEVQSMRMKRWKELQYEVERLERLKKYKDAIEALNEMMDLAFEGSKQQKWARLRIARLSEALKERDK